MCFWRNTTISTCMVGKVLVSCVLLTPGIEPAELSIFISTCIVGKVLVSCVLLTPGIEPAELSIYICTCMVGKVLVSCVLLTPGIEPAERPSHSYRNLRPLPAGCSVIWNNQKLLVFFKKIFDLCDMYLWSAAILKLDSHPKDNKGPAHASCSCPKNHHLDHRS